MSRGRTGRRRAAGGVLLLLGWLATGCIAPFPEREPQDGPARPSLWAVYGSQDEPHFHLLGSVHLGSERMLDLGPRVESAFASAQELVLEADLSQLTQTEIQQATRRFGVIEPPATLADRVTPETLDLLDAWASERGLAGIHFHGLEPWLVELTFALIEFQRLGYDPALGVDTLFQERATRAGVPVVGLESVDFQFRMLADLPLELQERMLRTSLRDRADFAENARTMIDAWARGDERALADVVFEFADDPEFGEYYARIVFDRNRRMADALGTLASDGKQRFVILGAAHMLGPAGVPALLAEQGFRIVEVQ